MRSARPRLLLVTTAAAIVAALAAGSVDRAAASFPETGARPGGSAAPTVIKGAARTVAGIRPTVNAFRNMFGGDNGGVPGGDPAGRRELNWDTVPDTFASPNALPSDFFNAATAPRARGIVLKTPGDHVAVSADRHNPDGARVRFGDINPSYPAQFKAFSQERLFSPVGSNVVNVTFFVPGTTTEAVVRGFGAVYTDVDRRESASFEYFDADGHSLGTFAVPRSAQGFSFLGVVFDEPVVARVRIRYGNRALGPADSRRYDDRPLARP
jgi:hypothetical protein